MPFKKNYGAEHMKHELDSYQYKKVWSKYYGAERMKHELDSFPSFGSEVPAILTSPPIFDYQSLQVL